MPSITAIALESLLHPNSNSDSNRNSRDSSPKEPSPPNRHNDDSHHTIKNNNIAGSSTAAAEAGTVPKKPSSQPYYISPALYATPEPVPIPDSSSISDSPSPYIVNRKRRNIRPAVASGSASRLDGSEIQQKPDSNQTNEIRFTETLDEEGQEGGDGDEESGLDVEWIGEGLVSKAGDALEEEEERVDSAEEEDFLDPRESMSAASSSEVEDGGSLRRTRCGGRTTLSNQSEFYDAAEDFFSDGSVSNSFPSFSTNIQKELHALRLNLIEEVERRRKAEGDLLHLHKQWQRVAKCLSQVGLSFPEILDSGNVQLEADPAVLCQEIVVTRLVSEAMERGLARAETEAVAEAIIDSKNHEISRLRDRLQYYEAVNREMSQRNQEAVELARQLWLRRKTRQSWIWGCIGVSISVGASLLAYSYIPQSDKGSLPTSDPDASSPSTMNYGESRAC